MPVGIEAYKEERKALREPLDIGPVITEELMR